MMLPMPRLTGRHKQVPALFAIERHHSHRIANSKGAQPQRLDEVSDDIQLRTPATERHGRGHVHNRAHRDSGALPIDTHQPLTRERAQACAQIEPTWIRPIVKAHVRDELLSRANARSGV